MAEERGREQEGYLEHAFRAEPGLRFLLHPLSQSEVPKRQPHSNVTLDLRTFIGHSETRSNQSKDVLPNRIGRFNGVRKQLADCCHHEFFDDAA